MTSAGESSAASPPRTRPERLRDFGRYLALVADELDALEQRDLPRLRELQEQRLELERELRPDREEEETGSRGEPLPFAEDLAGLLAEGLDTLQQGAEEDRISRDRWTTLEHDALRAMQGTRLRGVRRGQYLELASGDARLDVRF